MEALRDILQKKFGFPGFFANILYLLTAIAFTAHVSEERKEEKSEFSCFVNNDVASSTTSQKNIQTQCFSQYDEKFNKFPLSSFTWINFGVAMALLVFYSAFVTYFRKSWPKTRTSIDSDNEDRAPPKTRRLFSVYVIFLLLRFLVPILFILLQLVWLRLVNFPKDFICVHKNITVSCLNSIGKDKTRSATGLWIINVIFACLIFFEIIYLVVKIVDDKSMMYDPDFYEKYFFKMNRSADETLPLQTVSPTRPPQSPNVVKNMGTYIANVLARCKDFEINIAKMNLGKDGCAVTLDEMYIDLLITTKRENQILKYSKQREEIYQRYMEFPPKGVVIDNVREIFSSVEGDNDGKQPRTILVVGQPGIGKSMLSQKLLYDWAKENQQCQDTLPEITTLRFKFRLFHPDTCYNLKELLSKGTHLDPDNSIHDYAINNPSKLRLIFDGLDEMKVKETWKSEAETAEDSEVARMSVFSLFYKLVKGTLLPGATTLVTSRQTAEDIYSMMRFDRRVEIIGFTAEKVESYVSQFCQVRGVEKGECDAVWSYIKDSPLLLNLCYVPANCFLVCLTLVKSMDEVNSALALPKTITLTDLYQRAVRFIISERHSDYRNVMKKADCLRNDMNEPSIRKTLDKLGQLACRGMEERQLVFDSNDLGSRLSEDMIDSGLLSQLSTRNESYQYCFLHFTIQEFLAAKYIFEHEPWKVVKSFILDYFCVKSWNVVIQFLFGLLRAKAQEESRKDVIGMCENIMNVGIVLLLNCLFELQSDEVAKAIMERLRENEYEEVKSVNMPSIVYCLSLAPSWRQDKLSKLNFTNGLFNALALKLLSEALTKGMKYVKELEITFCELNDAAVEPLCAFIESGECMLTRLCLLANKITAVGAITLFRALKCSHCRITELDLSLNDLTDESIKELCETLLDENCQLTSLKLRGSKITGKRARKLFDAVMDERCRLISLNVSQNPIGNDGLKELSNGPSEKPSKLMVLHLCENKITHEGVKDLAKALTNKQFKLTELRLSSNNIGDDGLKELCNILTLKDSQLSVLFLSSIQVTIEGVKELARALNNAECSLTELDLTHTKIADDGVKELCPALIGTECKLTKLGLGVCKISDEGAKELFLALKSPACALKMLDVSNNNITDIGARDLAFAVEKGEVKLSQLAIWGNNFTSDGEELLRRSCENAYIVLWW